MSATHVHNPIVISDVLCIRCPACDLVCPGDIIYYTPKSKDVPEIRYPDECWFCGLCEQKCPTKAITIVFPEAMLAPSIDPITLMGGQDEL